MSLQEENMTGKNAEGRHPNVPLQYLTATSIIGDRVKNKQGDNLGKIDNLMINLATGNVEYIVVAHGGFLTINEKDFAIPFKEFTVDAENKCFIVDRTKEFIDNAPGFDINHWPETNFHGEEKYWSFI